MGLLSQQRQNTKASQRGFAMAMVLFIMVVLLLLGTGYLALAFHEANLTFKQERETQAFFLAEAGVQRTLYKLSRTEDWENDIPQNLYNEEALGPGTYTVTWDAASPNSGTINTWGNVEDRERKIDMKVKKRSSQ